MSAEWSTVDAYLAEKLLADDPALDATAIRARRTLQLLIEVQFSGEKRLRPAMKKIHFA